MATRILPPSSTTGGGASRATAILKGRKGGPYRPALCEVTTTWVDRKDAIKAAAKEKRKDGADQDPRRSRYSSLVAAAALQQDPTDPGRTKTTSNAFRMSTTCVQKPSVFKRISQRKTALRVVNPAQVAEERSE